MRLRFTVLILSALAAFSLQPGSAMAQPYPSRPIRLIVPFPPGGVTDVLARIVGVELGERLGQTVLIENRAGAGGTIGAAAVAKSPPDGYALLLGAASTVAVSPHLYPSLPYDPIRDLEPITQVASVPSVLIVNPSLAVTTVADLIGLALANPGQLGFGSAGPGTSSHLAGELLKSMAKIDVVHVPYKGGGPMMGDLVAGRVSFVIEPLPVALPYLKSGRVRGIAVSTAQRLTVLPDLPPISETLPGYDVTGWFGILAPVGTPPEVVARINGELVRLLRSQEMRERLAGLGAEPVGDSPGEFAAHIRREIQRWGELVRASGAKAQ